MADPGRRRWMVGVGRRGWLAGLAGGGVLAARRSPPRPAVASSVRDAASSPTLIGTERASANLMDIPWDLAISRDVDLPPQGPLSPLRRMLPRGLTLLPKQGRVGVVVWCSPIQIGPSGQGLIWILMIAAAVGGRRYMANGVGSAAIGGHGVRSCLGWEGVDFSSSRTVVGGSRRGTTAVSGRRPWMTGYTDWLIVGKHGC